MLKTKRYLPGRHPGAECRKGAKRGLVISITQKIAFHHKFNSTANSRTLRVKKMEK
jgi:hypothetical protein